MHELIDDTGEEIPDAADLVKLRQVRAGRCWCAGWCGGGAVWCGVRVACDA